MKSLKGPTWRAVLFYIVHSHKGREAHCSTEADSPPATTIPGPLIPVRGTNGGRDCKALHHIVASQTASVVVVVEQLYSSWLGTLITYRRLDSFFYNTQANFRPLVGSQRPSCAGPLVGRALPDEVGTAPTVPNLIPASGVHMPVGGMLALVGFGAVKGVSACASAPYWGFCASTFFCCCNDWDVACWRFKEVMRAARSLQPCQRILGIQVASQEAHLSICDASDFRW